MSQSEQTQQSEPLTEEELNRLNELTLIDFANGSPLFWQCVDMALRQKGIYHGMPMVNLGERFTAVGNTHDPFLKDLLDVNQRDEHLESVPDEGEEEACLKVRNAWELKQPWRGRWGKVSIVEKENGRVGVAFDPLSSPTFQRFDILAATWYARDRTTLLEAEETAQAKLRELVHDDQWRSYRLIDSFIEDAKSGVCYVLRKGRPTLAFRPEGDTFGKALCALCFHPMAYYDGTWAGAMAPSDEVIAHLLHIRADEHYFWRKANHIPFEWPNSGV